MTNHLFSICGEITWESASIIIESIYDDYIKEPFDHVAVLISSQGGDIDAAWAIYTSLVRLGCKVFTVANGRLYSAGIIVYLAGHVRYVYPESIYLFHPSIIEVTESERRAAYKVKEELDGFDIDEKIFTNLLKKTLTKATKRDISRLTHKHKSAYVDAKQAIQLGLAHKLIENINQI